MEGSTLEEGPKADNLNRILGGEERDKHGKYGNEEKGSAGEENPGGKEIHGGGGRVEGCKRKYAGGGTWSGHAQQNFGRGSA